MTPVMSKFIKNVLVGRALKRWNMALRNGPVKKIFKSITEIRKWINNKYENKFDICNQDNLQNGFIDVYNK